MRSPDNQAGPAHEGYFSSRTKIHHDSLTHKSLSLKKLLPPTQASLKGIRFATNLRTRITARHIPASGRRRHDSEYTQGRHATSPLSACSLKLLRGHFHSFENLLGGAQPIDTGEFSLPVVIIEQRRRL